MQRRRFINELLIFPKINQFIVLKYQNLLILVIVSKLYENVIIPASLSALPAFPVLIALSAPARSTRASCDIKHGFSRSISPSPEGCVLTNRMLNIV